MLLARQADLGTLDSGANLLSLVFATTDRQYVFLGDLDESIHPEVVPALEDSTAEVPRGRALGLPYRLPRP